MTLNLTVLNFKHLNFTANRPNLFNKLLFCLLNKILILRDLDYGYLDKSLIF